MRKTHKNAKLLEILLVEDNPADIRFINEVLKEARLANRVTPLADGDSALRYLRGQGEYAGAVKPDLVLLDLNLPGKDGRKLLAEIRRDPLLSALPVIVLSTSSAPDDVAFSYDLGATCYLVKPADPVQLIQAALRLENVELALVAPAVRPLKIQRKGGRHGAA
jgi:chemotaxis family two-component system response regulator Rcp1